jgi:hypothetical protein
VFSPFSLFFFLDRRRAMVAPIRNRIKTHRRVRAGDLVPHELNWVQLLFLQGNLIQMRQKTWFDGRLMQKYGALTLLQTEIAVKKPQKTRGKPAHTHPVGVPAAPN